MAAGRQAAADGTARQPYHSSEVVDWGRSGPDEMITLNAMRSLPAARRPSQPARSNPQQGQAITRCSQARALSRTPLLGRAAYRWKT